MDVLFDNFQAVKRHNLTKMWLMKIVDERVSIYYSKSDSGFSHAWFFPPLIFMCLSVKQSLSNSPFPGNSISCNNGTAIFTFNSALLPLLIIFALSGPND